MVLQTTTSTTTSPEITQGLNFGRTILRRRIQGSSSSVSATTSSSLSSAELLLSNRTTTTKSLDLMMLGCEDKGPYGPTDHTATMFLNLICQALLEDAASNRGKNHQQQEKVNNNNNNKQPHVDTVSVTIYQCQQEEYPQSQEEWDSYHGIILPGSFSSAYDSDPWIHTLRHVIQTELFHRQRPTLGVCFGHQIYAHSLIAATTNNSNGQHAVNKCPSGPQGGRKIFPTSTHGNELFHQDSLHLYYTHGDMVYTLPDCAISLGGNEHVPIQAAAYYHRKDDNSTTITTDQQAEHGVVTVTTTTTSKRPVAITFQSHPEYVVAPQTLQNILHAMAARGDLTNHDVVHAQKDAENYYEHVKRHSLDVTIASCKLLGWFPSE